MAHGIMSPTVDCNTPKVYTLYLNTTINIANSCSNKAPPK